MNEKDARENIACGYEDSCFDQKTFDQVFAKSQGYLEALEKAKVLEDAIKKIKHITYDDLIYLTTKEALAKWEEEI